MVLPRIGVAGLWSVEFWWRHTWAAVERNPFRRGLRPFTRPYETDGVKIVPAKEDVLVKEMRSSRCRQFADYGKYYGSTSWRSRDCGLMQRKTRPPCNLGGILLQLMGQVLVVTVDLSSFIRPTSWAARDAIAKTPLLSEKMPCRTTPFVTS